jgi:hypothetical protein
VMKKVSSKGAKLDRFSFMRASINRFWQRDVASSRGLPTAPSGAWN